MKEDINYINLQNSKKFSYNKKNPIGGRLLYGDIISHSFKIANNFSHQELLVKTELKLYEDIGLDPTKAYKISYIKKSEISENEILLEAFAIDKDAISKKYAKNLKLVKHIDFLAAVFLAFETLYTNKILLPKNDLFVYMALDEAFVCFYKDGEYISSKRVKSISEMLRDLENRDILLSYEELQEILSTKGVDKSNYELLEYDIFEYIEETFDELFTKIKNLSLHNRNVYNFSQIDRVFFSCAKGEVVGLKESMQEYLGSGEFLKLNFFKNKEDDTLDAICKSYIKDKLLQKQFEHNLSIYLKKDPFYKSEVGKFVLASVTGIVLAALYPFYLQDKIAIKIKENEILSQKEKKISKSSKKYQKELKELKSKMAIFSVKQQKNLKNLQTLQSIANSLLALKSKDTQYTEMFLKINEALKNYNLSIDKIRQEDAHVLSLELLSKDSKRDTIALLMKDLINSGFSSVTSGEITLRDDGMIRSAVRVEK